MWKIRRIQLGYGTYYFNGVLIIANVASKQTSLFAGDVYQVKC